MIVIINKGEVYQGLYFANESLARNYVKWAHPKKRWADLPPNMMKCKYTGMVMRFEEIAPYDQLSKDCAEKELILARPKVKFDADNFDRVLYQKDHQ